MEKRKYGKGRTEQNITTTPGKDLRRKDKGKRKDAKTTIQQ